MELIESNLTLYAADKRKLHIKGYIPVKLKARSKDGSSIETSDLLYFVEGLNKTYQLKDAMEQLKVIPQNLPVVGAATIEEEPTKDDDDTEDPATRRERTILTVAQLDRPGSRTRPEASTSREDPADDQKSGIAPCSCPIQKKAPDHPRLDRDI